MMQGRSVTPTPVDGEEVVEMNFDQAASNNAYASNP